MGKGIYLSQGVIRAHSTVSSGSQFFGDAKHGFEIVPYNIVGVLNRLGVDVEAWDAAPYSPPRYPYYFQWLKAKLVQGTPVVVFVGGVSSEYKYAHAEATAGYFSHRPLTDSTVYPSDEIVIYSGGDLLHTWRRVDSYIDAGPNQMNCTNGLSSGEQCMSKDRPWGYALLGITDPAGQTIPTSITVSDNGKEPPPPHVFPTRAHVTVTGPLTVGQSYVIYRFDGVNSYPKNSKFHGSNFKTSHKFVASAEVYSWQDTLSFPSNSVVYYVTVAQ